MPRPCCISDIYIIIKRLYKEKIITKKELEIMVKYGFLGREPNCYDNKEVYDWPYWESAMDKLYPVLYKKGIIKIKQNICYN